MEREFERADDREGKLSRLLRELMVPGVVGFILLTVWCAGWVQRLEDRSRYYRAPVQGSWRAYGAEPDEEARAQVEPDEEDLP